MFKCTLISINHSDYVLIIYMIFRFSIYDFGYSNIHVKTVVNNVKIYN
jgi:hypothetical protein